MLTKAEFAKHATIALNTYDRRFSGWQDALEQAGLGHMYCRGSEESVRLFRLRASDETLLRELQRVAKLVDKPILTTTDFDRYSKMAYVTPSNRFGSWQAALERAGLGHLYSGATIIDRRNRNSRSLSNEEILNLIRQVAEQTGRSDLSQDKFTSVTHITHKVINRRFGNWKNAVEAVGSSAYSRSGLRYSEEECFENIAVLWTYYGRTPTSKEFGSPPSSVKLCNYYKRWGSLGKTLKAFLEWIDTETSGDSKLTTILKFRVMRQDGFRCAVCGCGPAALDAIELHIEHVPKAQGKTLLSNLWTLCSGCDLGELAGKDAARRGQYNSDDDSRDKVKARKKRPMPKCPDETLLDEVRRVGDIVGKPVLTTTDFARHSGISASTIKQRYGSWRIVLESAGLGHLHYLSNTKGSRTCRYRYSEEELIEELQRVAVLVKKLTLIERDFAEHSKIAPVTLARSALEKAGLSHRYSEGNKGIRQRYLDEELLEDIRRVAAIVGKPALTRRDYLKYAKFGKNTIAERFGGWYEALERAGLSSMHSKPNKNCRKTYSDEVLLEELRRVAQLVETPTLSLTNFKKHSSIYPSILIKRFGSWRAALKHAGVTHHRKRHYSDEDLLDEVRRVARLVEGPVLSHAEFKKHSRIDSSTVRNRFGSWLTTLERAGVGHLYHDRWRTR